MGANVRIAVLAVALGGLLTACAPTSALRSTPINLVEDADNSHLIYAVGVTQLRLTAKAAETELPAQCQSALSAYETAWSQFVEDEFALRTKGVEVGRLARDVLPFRTSSRPWGEREGQASRPEQEQPPALTGAPLKAALDASLPLVRDLRSAERRAESSYDSALARLEVARRVCPDRPVTIDVRQSVRPSQSGVFALRLHGGLTSSDDLTVQTQQGVLTSMAMTADDQSAQIATAIGKSIGQFFAPSPWGSLEGYQAARGEYPPPPPPLLEEECVIPPETLDALEYLTQNERCLTAEALHNILSSAQIWTPQEPLRSVFTPMPPETIFDLEDILGSGGEQQFGEYYLRVDCGAYRADRLIQNEVEGLVLALPMSCRFRITLEESIIGQGAFLGTADRWLYVMPVHRQVFVRNETRLTLTDGALTEANLKRPSPVAAIVQLPGTILGGVVSGITAGLEGDEAIRNAEVARLRAETALLAARAEREARQTPQAAPPASPPAAGVPSPE